MTEISFCACILFNLIIVINSVIANTVNNQEFVEQINTTIIEKNYGHEVVNSTLHRTENRNRKLGLKEQLKSIKTNQIPETQNHKFDSKDEIKPTTTNQTSKTDKENQEANYFVTEQEVIDLSLNDLLGPPDLSSTKYLRCSLKTEVIEHIESYREVVNIIIDLVVTGEFRGKAYETLAALTDKFGARMTGSKQLEDSIDWIIEKSRNENLENVHTEPLKAPHWVRNNEFLTLLEPRREELMILGLGSSVGTPPEGITAEVSVVRSFEELEMNGHKVAGKIVVFNPPWTTYMDMVKYRAKGASRAAKHNAVASLVRSITPFSINSPHTGWQIYDGSANKTPSASITQEDAEMFQRFQDRGEKILVTLQMGAKNLPDCTTRNTIAEQTGDVLPEEVVVVSGHLDSWDVGVGAMDDGGGSIVSWMVPLILKKLGLRAKRTVRTVLFSGEEQGLHGGKAYFERHSGEKHKYQLLLESDIGTFNPFGLSFSGTDEALCVMGRILSLMTPLNTTNLAFPMSGGPDITFWKQAGVPTGSILNSNDKYFWFHHSAGDTMSVQDSDTLDKCAALWTAVAYVTADMNITVPR